MAKPFMVGDATFDAERLEQIEWLDAFADRSYVPGYSEARRDNERAIAEGRPQDVKRIARLQWVRVSRPDGRDVDMRDMLEYARLGFQLCTMEDLEEHGYGMPPTAYIAADNTIRREDTALAICSWEQAQRNERKQKEINASFHGTPARFEPDTRTKVTGSLDDMLSVLEDEK